MGIQSKALDKSFKMAPTVLFLSNLYFQSSKNPIRTAYRNSWTLDARVGCWTLDAELWTLDSGRWTLDAGRWTLDAGLWTLDSGRWTLDSGRWTLDAGRYT